MKMFHVEQLEMERLGRCPLCLGEGPFSYWVRSKDALVSGEWFHVEQCGACGLLFTHPRPKPQDISKFYRVADYLSHDETVRGWLAWLYSKVRKRMILLKIKWLKRFIPGGGRSGKQNPGGRRRNKGRNSGGRLLDMGCGTGFFARSVMEQTGMQVLCFEPAEEAARRAREKGLEVLQTQDELKALAAGQFRCITYWHVLEHAHDFMGELKRAHRLLTDGGILAVAVPLHQSADGRIYKEDWAAYDLPRHLFHFGRETLTRAAAQAGFGLLGRRGLTFDSYYVALLSEKHRRGRHSLPGVLRACLAATWSNVVATMGRRPWSSEVFFFAKDGPGPGQ